MYSTCGIYKYDVSRDMRAFNGVQRKISSVVLCFDRVTFLNFVRAHVLIETTTIIHVDDRSRISANCTLNRITNQCLCNQAGPILTGWLCEGCNRVFLEDWYVGDDISRSIRSYSKRLIERISGDLERWVLTSGPMIVPSGDKSCSTARLSRAQLFLAVPERRPRGSRRTQDGARLPTRV